ncbi:glucosamine-fructose-6-phosphate aminotransferase [Neisseria meningitidis]|uniref:glucosamine-fructose-6-phosphate aminotransferase n=1 Tax=Neisseria meningitidis TaxID=487 RepID=UPI003F6847C1
MKPAVWAALLLCACTSNFGDREHQFLRYSGLTKTSTALPRLAVLFVLSAARRLVLIFVNPLYQTEEGIAQTVVKGKTTRAEVEARFGKRNPFGCYAYHEVSLPIYNFLPTNFIYMKSERRHWEWCVDYDWEGVVRDYRFTHKVEKDERSVIRDAVGVIRKEAGKSLSQPEK